VLNWIKKIVVFAMYVGNIYITVMVLMIHMNVIYVVVKGFVNIVLNQKIMIA